MQSFEIENLGEVQLGHEHHSTIFISVTALGGRAWQYSVTGAQTTLFPPLPTPKHK